MIYLQGNYARPETWYIVDDPGTFGAIKKFDSYKQARSWVIEEIKRRSKAMNRVKHAWCQKDKLTTSSPDPVDL